MKIYAHSFLLSVLFLLAALPGGARAEDFTNWAKLISFRPDTKVQEKLQGRKADAEGNRYKTLHIERARGNLFMQSAGLAITKMPAVEGKPMTMAALFRRVRGHFEDFVDQDKMKFALENPEEKAVWDSDSGEGTVVKFTEVASGVDHPMMMSESTSEHLILSTLAGTKSPTQQLVSGHVWIGVVTATPLEGCVLQVRAAFRPTMAATYEDEWKVAEVFGSVWIGMLEKVRKFVKEQSGDSLPELIPPTMAYVPWNTVSKSFHQPTQAWIGVEGTWRSTDKDQRFRIEFHGDSSCDLVERNAKGKELRVTLPVIASEDAKAGYTIERPNDRDEVLEFYDFKPGTRTAILERKPEPSKLVLKRNSKGRLVGNWYGFSISRDASGNLQEIKQPSKMAAKIFEFTQAAD